MHTQLREGNKQSKRKQQAEETQTYVTWYKPPYNAAVKTPIGRKSKDLIQKHFLRKQATKENLQQMHTKAFLQLCEKHGGNYQGSQQQADEQSA